MADEGKKDRTTLKTIHFDVCEAQPENSSIGFLGKQVTKTSWSEPVKKPDWSQRPKKPNWSDHVQKPNWGEQINSEQTTTRFNGGYDTLFHKTFGETSPDSAESFDILKRASEKCRNELDNTNGTVKPKSRGPSSP